MKPLSLKDMGTTSSTPSTSDHPIFTQSDDISSDEDSPSETSNRGIKRKERKERKKQLLTDIRTRQSLQRQASIRKLTKDLGPYWTKPPQLPTQHPQTCTNSSAPILHHLLCPTSSATHPLNRILC